MRLRRGYDRVYKPTRYFRQMLSYEEVQRRLNNHYGGKLTIIEYNGTHYKGILHCKECGTFETKYPIGGYLAQNFCRRQDCELCYRKMMINHYNSLLVVDSLDVFDYYFTTKDSYKYYYAKVKCSICGMIYTTRVDWLTSIKNCRHCNYNEKTLEYSEILARHNCIYISRRIDENKVTFLKYKCGNCNKIYETNLRHISTVNGICKDCNITGKRKLKEASRQDTKLLGLKTGKILTNYVCKSEVHGIHLLCGKRIKTNKINFTKSDLCRCSNRLNSKFSYTKEHNKHLVEEYLIILYNVQKLKNFFVKHNQLQNILQEPRTILEHIDGWINNYETIRKKYPNGDLGTVLENNPLYEKCRKVFYPIMDKYGIERIKDLGGK